MPIRLNFTNTRSPTLSIPLDLADVTILDAYLDDHGACQITVESTVDQVLCHRCGQVITASRGYGEPVTVRQLPVWGRTRRMSSALTAIFDAPLSKEDALRQITDWSAEGLYLDLEGYRLFT